MALVPITSWSLQSPNGTVWVPSITTRGIVSFTSGGSVITAIAPVLQDAVDTTIWTPTISNTGVVTLTSSTITLPSTLRWAHFVDTNNVSYAWVVTATGLVKLLPRVDLSYTLASWVGNTDDTIGYRIFYGRVPTNLTTYVTVGLVTSAYLTELLLNKDGTWYCSIAAFDAAGNVSAQSAVQSIRIIRETFKLRRNK